MLRSRAVTSGMPGAGDSVGEYHLIRPLGEGGMGVVFEAVCRSDGETVALKILRSELARDDVYRRRLEHEARAASEVRHKHLVPVIAAGEADGHPYLAMGYVRGRSLKDR